MKIPIKRELADWRVVMAIFYKAFSKLRTESVIK
jgi:hypothetical protein